MEHNETLPQLSHVEVRVLGSLIEKSRTTPEYYPMTLKGLQAACNQKTARNPVVQYDESDIVESLDSLRKKGLIATVVGGGSRVTKYKHTLAIKFPLLPQELVIIALLFLRGPLTAGEINSSSGRLYEFEGIREINEFLIKLKASTPQYLTALTKGPGQKEIRYVHLFKAFDEQAYADQTTSVSRSESTLLEDRLDRLEQELAALRTEFDRLMKELT